MLAHLFVIREAVILQEAAPLTTANWLSVFLKTALAKSGVPLLSLISGYLAVWSLSRYGYLMLVWRKIKRLVWPLVWANLAFIVLITWPEQSANPGYRPDLSIAPFDAGGWLAATFAFYKLPANAPLFFLKDLFTCFLLLPILLALARIRYLNLLVVLWMAWKCIYLKSDFLIEVYPVWFFRFDIVFAFYVGILLFVNQNRLSMTNRGLSFVLIALFLLVAFLASYLYVVYAKPDHETLFLWLDFTVKSMSVLACIALMNLLNNSEGWVARLLRRLSPYAFSMFLTHAITFQWFHETWLYFLGQPEFFAASGITYIVLILAVATLVAVLARTGWGFLMKWLRSATGLNLFAERAPAVPKSDL